MEVKSACENRLRMLKMTARHKATGHVHHAPYAHHAPMHITHPRTPRTDAHHTPHTARHTTQRRRLCTHAHHAPTQSPLRPPAWAGALPIRAPVRPGRPPFPALSSLSGHLKQHASNPKDEPPWWAFWPRNFLYVTAKSQRRQNRPHEQLREAPAPELRLGWGLLSRPAPTWGSLQLPSPVSGSMRISLSSGSRCSHTQGSSRGSA